MSETATETVLPVAPVLPEVPVLPVAPDFKVPELDWAAIDADPDASVAPKLLAPVMLRVAEANSLLTQYQAVSNVDAAIATYVDTHESPEFTKLRKEIELAEKLISKNVATMQEEARKSISSENVVDPQLVKAQYSDLLTAIKEDVTPKAGLRAIFKSLRHVTCDISEAGRETNWTPLTDYGYALLSALDLPKLEKGDGTSTAAPKADPALTARNKVVKAWGKLNGWTVQDKGPTPKALIEAWEAAGSPE